MEINGLPLHPLVVHAAVVFGPLAAVAALVYVFVPRWRDRLRWPMLVLVLIATAAIWTAFLTGVNFRDSQAFYSQGELGEKIQKHQDLATKLRIVTSGFAVIAILAVWLHRRTGFLHRLVDALLALAAVGALVLVVLTGDAGAQAVWGS